MNRPSRAESPKLRDKQAKSKNGGNMKIYKPINLILQSINIIKNDRLPPVLFRSFGRAGQKTVAYTEFEQ